MMAKFTAILERAEDGSWSAYMVTPSLVVGCVESKEAALEDLRGAMAFWLSYMKDTGQAIPVVSAELVSFEVAA